MEFNATFIVSAISFIVFTIIMNAIFYKPLQNIVQERQKFLDETNEEAENHQKKSECILKDKQHKVNKTKGDARKLILEKSDKAKDQRNCMVSDAQKQSKRTVEAAKDGLQKSKEEAQEVLSEESKKLAESILAKILGT